MRQNYRSYFKNGKLKTSNSLCVTTREISEKNIAIVNHPPFPYQWIEHFRNFHLRYVCTYIYIYIYIYFTYSAFESLSRGEKRMGDVREMKVVFQKEK